MNTRRSIVVALDLSEYSEIVLEHAIDQAARTDAPDLHFMTVVSDAKEIESAKQRLAELVLPALEDLDSSDWRMRLHVRVGKAPEEIAALAEDVLAHLIVIGRFGTHHRLRRLGSVANKVIDIAGCPTLVVGLTSHTADAQPQCPACVEVRALSNGERWFCDEHSAPDRMRLSSIVTPTSIVRGGGGTMW